MALEPGRRSPPSKTAKRGKGLTKPYHLGTRPIYFKRSQKARIIQARYRPLKPRYVPTNNVPKKLTTKSHHPAIKRVPPTPLKPQSAEGARGEEGRAQTQATATAMEAGVSLDI